MKLHLPWIHRCARIVAMAWPLLLPALPGAALAQLSCSPAPCVLPNVRATSGSAEINGAAIAVNPRDANNIVVVSTDLNCSSRRGIYVSANRGSTWTTHCATVPPDSQANPSLGFAATYNNRGHAFVASVNYASSGPFGPSSVSVQASIDSGASFGTPTVPLPVTDGSYYYFPSLEADTSGVSPFYGSLYMSTTRRSSVSSVLISYQRPSGGLKWWTTRATADYAYPDMIASSDLAIGRDGTLYLTYLKCRAPVGRHYSCGGTVGTVYLQKSTDGGVRWGGPVAVAAIKLAPAYCEDQIDFMTGCVDGLKGPTNIPVIAVDKSTGPGAGRLYVALNSYSGTLARVMVVMSGTGGATWSRAVPMSDWVSPGDQFAPWINVDGSGRVGVTWLDRRNDPENVKYEAFAAVSTDYGASFSPNVRLSEVASDPRDLDPYLPSYLGMSFGNAWSGDTLLMAYLDLRDDFDYGRRQTWLAGTRP